MLKTQLAALWLPVSVVFLLCPEMKNLTRIKNWTVGTESNRTNPARSTDMVAGVGFEPTFTRL